MSLVESAGKVELSFAAFQLVGNTLALINPLTPRQSKIYTSLSESQGLSDYSGRGNPLVNDGSSKL